MISSFPHFNPLPPHGGRLSGMLHSATYREISIHSLRMEGDYSDFKNFANLSNFNPLPPHGGRLRNPQHHVSTLHFNPLPPHGGRQLRNNYHPRSHAISIHSLRMEGDVASVVVLPIVCAFQSTPSAWRETWYSYAMSEAEAFQSTPSAWRET